MLLACQQNTNEMEITGERKKGTPREGKTTKRPKQGKTKGRKKQNCET
jgi:hypothetical protein